MVLVVEVIRVVRVWFRVAQCIDKEIFIRKICNIDIGIDIDKENFENIDID